MRVLHISAAGERGGLEVVLLNVLKCLDRSRFIPQVLFLEDGPFVREVEEEGVATHIIKAGRVREMLRGGRSVAKIVQVIQSERIHVVHTWNAKAHIYGGLAAAIAGVPSLYHLQGVPKLTFSRDGLVSMLSVMIPAGQTVACSAYVVDAFRRAWHSRREVRVIHNGVIAVEPTARHAPSVREEFEIPDAASMIVMATRLQRWKGVHVFLDAAAQVAQVRPETCFVIVGGTMFGLEEGYALELRQQAERLGIGHAVRFVGFRSDVLQFFLAADLVVHSSIEPEPFGMVLLEAMACSRAVIASNRGGPLEIVDNDVTGLLVPPEDPKSLAQAILALVGDPTRRIRMGQAGAVRVREHFSAESTVHQLQDLYEEIVREHPIDRLTASRERATQ